MRSQLTDTLDGELDKRIVYFDAIRLETHTSDTLSTFIRYDKERITEDFEISEGVIIPPGTYSWSRTCVTLGTSSHRAVSYTGWICPGDFYDGTRDSIGSRLNWRPVLPRLLACTGSGLLHRAVRHSLTTQRRLPILLVYASRLRSTGTRQLILALPQMSATGSVEISGGTKCTMRR